MPTSLQRFGRRRRRPKSYKRHLTHLLAKQNKFTYIFFWGVICMRWRQRWMIRSFLTFFHAGIKVPVSFQCSWRPDAMMMMNIEDEEAMQFWGSVKNFNPRRLLMVFTINDPRGTA
jgi:hypothetical protein